MKGLKVGLARQDVYGLRVFLQGKESQCEYER